MKKHLLPTTALGVALALVLLAPAIAFSQNPTSGALLTITSTDKTVNLAIYDSQIHTGVVQVPPCGPAIPTDAYVLQGGAATGCDPGDAFETAQHTGTATLGNFSITTAYCTTAPLEGETSCSSIGPGNGCNTAGTICANPDTGFLTVTNQGAAFTGTISLTGTSPIGGAGSCPVGGVASDSFTGTLSGNGGSVTLALGTPGIDGASLSDSSNCGGFTAGQTQTLVAGQTNTFLIGADDYLFSPTNSASGDQLTVTPIPVPAGPLGLNNWGAGNFGSETPFASPLRFSAPAFPNEACIPYADFSAANNPVCVELQLVCTPGNAEANDCNTFIYTAQTDYTIDQHSFPPPSDLIGGPAFLGDHNDQCVTTGFNFNMFLSFTAGIDPPLTKGGSRGNSCFAATFDPTQPSIPAGTTVSTFSGFEAFVSDTKVNRIYSRSFFPEILVWDSSTSSGNPVTNLSLCPAVNLNGSCATPGVSPPWVNLSLIQAPNSICPAGFPPAGPLPSFFNTGLLPGDEAGEYVFLWNTNTNVKHLAGCQVKVLLQFDTGLFVSPATFQYVF